MKSTFTNVLHENSISAQKPKKMIFEQMDNISVVDSCSDVDVQKQKTPIQTVRRSPRKSCTLVVLKVSLRSTMKKSLSKISPSKGHPTKDNAAGTHTLCHYKPHEYIIL